MYLNDARSFIVVDQLSELKIYVENKGSYFKLIMSGVFNSLSDYIYFEFNGESIPFGSKKKIRIDKNNFTAGRLQVAGIIVGSIEKYKDELTITQHDTTLTSYEIRTLVYTGKLPQAKAKKIAPGAKLRTDLHAHYSGTVSARDLIDVATNYGEEPYYLGRNYLNNAGVNVDIYKTFNLNSVKEQTHFYEPTGLEQEFIDIRSLSKTDTNRIENLLSIQQTDVITFYDLERIYDFRKPLLTI